MKIKRKSILDALRAVQPGVASKESIQQSASFVFDDGRVFSYNDEISVSVPLVTGLTGSVPAKEFQAFISKLKVEDIDIKSEGNELLIVAGKSQAGICMEDEIKLPLEELGMPEDWTELPKEFSNAVQACLFSTGKDQTKFMLTHVHVNGDCVESSDGYRATRYYMAEGSESCFPENLLIPLNAAKNIVSYGVNEYSITNGWLHFRNADDIVFSCRWPDGDTYPNIDHLIDAQGTPIQLPAGLLEVMDRAVVLADGERLTLFMEGNGSLIMSTEKDTGWFEEETDIDYKGNPLEFDMYPDFLSKILKIKATTTVNDKLMKFETNEFIHVVALLPPKKKGK